MGHLRNLWKIIFLVLVLSYIMIACERTSSGQMESRNLTPDEASKTVTATRIATAVRTQSMTETASIKSIGTDTVYKTPGVRATRTPTQIPTPRPTPWGSPAKIIASMPSTTRCTTWGTDGCRWNFQVVFQSENGIGGQLSRIRRVYFNKKGVAYTLLGGTGWSKSDLKIKASGTTTYSSWVRTKFNSSGDLRNGYVEVSYEGYDDHGNFFSGKVKSTLASNK